MCACVIVCGGLTPMGGRRYGQWELSVCPVRMCPVGFFSFLFFSIFFFFVCLVWLHKQMGADILISTGNTLSLFSAGIWHQQATEEEKKEKRIPLHLCGDARCRCATGQRNVNEALPARIWRHNRPDPMNSSRAQAGLKSWAWMCSGVCFCTLLSLFLWSLVWMMIKCPAWFEFSLISCIPQLFNVTVHCFPLS